MSRRKEAVLSSLPRADSHCCRKSQRDSRYPEFKKPCQRLGDIFTNGRRANGGIVMGYSGTELKSSFANSAPDPQSSQRADWSKENAGRNPGCHRAPLKQNGTQPESRRMQALASNMSQSQKFYERYSKNRAREAAAKEPPKSDDAPPIFNKRLFASHGSVVLTPKARRIMARNARLRPDQMPPPLPSSDLQAMVCVVEGLKLVHRGLCHVKDAIAHVITFEQYSAGQFVVKRPHEDTLSCYYVVEGAVEVTYDLSARQARNVYQPNIVYSHGTGEYLGLVSPEGPSEDLAPPATIFTREATEFLRIDRAKFHQVVARMERVLMQEKRHFLAREDCILSAMPIEAREKILTCLTKMEYSPRKIILQQNEISDSIIYIASGRCQVLREVLVAEAERRFTFCLGTREPCEFVGEECVLDREPSYCSLMALTPTVCFKLHRSALEMLTRDLLQDLLEQYRNNYPSPADLNERGYTASVWDCFKHRQVKVALREGGKLRLLHPQSKVKVQDKPPTPREMHQENMFRFIAKGGAHYEPVRIRAQSAVTRRLPRTPRQASTPRPNTAPNPPTLVPELPAKVKDGAALPKTEEEDEEGEEDDEDDDDDDANSEAAQSASSLVKTLEKYVAKIPRETINNIMKKGDEREVLKALQNTDIGRQLRLAWQAENDQREDRFTKTTVLATMTTEDIVRKAKVIAEKKAEGVAPGQDDDDGESWHTALHEENRTAKLAIAANKFRCALLRRKMRGLDRRRARMAKERVRWASMPHGSTLPSRGDVTLTSDETEIASRSNDDEPKRFALDVIQEQYQGLDPDEARRKAESYGSSIMFVQRLKAAQRRSESAEGAGGEETSKTIQPSGLESKPSKGQRSCLSPKTPGTNRQRTSSASSTGRRTPSPEVSKQTPKRVGFSVTSGPR